MKPTKAKLNSEMTLTVNIFNEKHLDVLKLFILESEGNGLKLQISNYRHCGLLRDGHLLVTASKEDILG